MAVLTSRFLGSIVEKGSTVMVKYPDGTFGLSMVNEGDSGANQKIAFELCRRVVKRLDIRTRMSTNAPSEVSTAPWRAAPSRTVG